MCCLELQVSNWITARGLSRARSLWTNTLNRFATAAGKKDSYWGLHGLGLTRDLRSSEILVAAASSTTPHTAIPLPSRRDWKPPISNLAPAFVSVQILPPRRRIFVVA